MWAGNTGTPTGGDHCGSAPTGTTIATYQQLFSYDALDRFNTGPSGVTTYSATHIHAAVSLGNVPSQYASYDDMGNMTCRNVDTTTAHSCGISQTGAQMTYDNEGRLASWTAPSGTSASDVFLYDNAGNRVLQRTTNGTTVSKTITFDSYTETTLTGSTTSTTKYYSADGSQVAMRKDGLLFYSVAGTLGSNSVVLKSDGTPQAIQLFAPFGTQRYSDGSMPTTDNFTGQQLDSQTGLLYYGFRYYDPVSGRFTRTDTVQGNPQGMDTYAYVNENPETWNDPTGHCGSWDWGCWGQSAWNAAVTVNNVANNVNHAVGSAVLNAGDFLFGVTDSINDVKTLFNGNASIWDKVVAGGDLVFNVVSDVLMVTGIGELARAADVGIKLGVDAVKLGVDLFKKDAAKAAFTEGKNLLKQGVKAVVQGVADTCGGGLSFTAATTVATAQGAHAIASLHPGDKVWAYNTKTQKMELQPILHVWINHDNDLVDLTIASTVPGKKGHADQQTTEVIHTNKKHPFLTQEAGFVQVADLNVGMHVVEADGNVGVITGWTVVPGTMTMYNLEVAQDHTFTVGDGQWVVHNAGPRCGPVTAQIAQSGTLTDLWHKGYDMSGHFIDEFLNEKGLSSGDIENILKNGDYYHRYVDTYNRVTGKTLGRNPRIFSIIHNQFRNELHSIFEGGRTRASEFTWLPNPFAP